MSEQQLWHVYPAGNTSRSFASERDARRMMRRCARLGIQASLYASEGGGSPVLVERRDAQGQPYRLPDDVPDDISGIKGGQ
jgi:hypothetical protein